MKIDKWHAIRAAAQTFVRLNGDLFTVVGNRWWYLTPSHVWVQERARTRASDLVGELVAFLPQDTEAQQWLVRNLASAYTSTQILAMAGQLLRAEGLPGPGFTPPVDSSEC
jgi:hypothetical protein